MSSPSGVADGLWLIFLLYALFYFWRARQKLIAAFDWLKTNGTIVACHYKEEKGRIWHQIDYSYEVNDQQLVGQFIVLNPYTNNPHQPYTCEQAHQKQIEVYYNPNLPEQSTLDVRVPKKLNVMLLLISGILLVHLTILAYRYFF